MFKERWKDYVPEGLYAQWKDIGGDFTNRVVRRFDDSQRSIKIYGIKRNEGAFDCNK